MRIHPGAHRVLRLTAALLVAAVSFWQFTGEAAAFLHRVGPINPAPSVGSFPAWYQDNTGLTLEFCNPLTQSEVDGGWCLLLPADVTIPEVFPTNFFDEHFYYSAGTDPVTEFPNSPLNRVVLVLALESAFAAGPPIPGDQIVFARIRVDARHNTVFPRGTYRFLHPYGEDVVVVPDDVTDRIFITEDVGIACTPGDFTCALNSRLGPFLLPSANPGGAEMPPLTAANPVPDDNAAHFGGVLAPTAYPGTGKSYIADPARSGPVTGSPVGRNFFRIEYTPAPPLPPNFNGNLDGNGNNFIQTNNFSLVGRIFSGNIPGNVKVDRAEYTRNATPEQKLDVFATGFETTQARIPSQPPPPGVFPVLSFFDAPCTDNNGGPPFGAPVGATETSMFRAGNNYWAQAPVAPVPIGVCVRDSVSSTFFPKSVVDEVIISEAFFDPNAGSLSVKAFSSDEINPPVLTLGGFGDLASGSILVSPLAAPPSHVHVQSSAGGSGLLPVTTNGGILPATGVTLQASPASPRLVGTQVTVIAAGQGGTGVYEYQFSDNTSGTLQVIQAYSASSVRLWNTTGVAAGTYAVRVDVRSLGSASLSEADNTIAYTLTIPAPPAGVLLTPDKPSPQPPGTQIVFVATGQGGTGPYEYQFSDNVTGTMAVRQAYSTTSTRTWDTTGVANGTYAQKVDVRNLGSASPSEASSTINYALSNPAATGVSLFATPASPQTAGTPETFIAVGSGGSGIYEFEFRYKLTGVGTDNVGQAYSSNAIWNWNTTSIPSGNYDIKVNARRAGSTAASEASATILFQFAGTGPVTNVTVGAAPASPQPPGTSVVFTAQASGGGTPEYQFWLFDGTSWTSQQGYGAGNTWTWNTTGRPTGAYAVQVWARSVGSGAAYDAFSQVATYVLGGAVTPVSSVVLNPPPSPASPQPPGTSVLFTAQASGGSGTPEYQFWLFDGTSWTSQQGYGAGNTWTWNTTGRPAGTYQVQVWARNAGSPAGYEAITQVTTYVLSNEIPVSAVVLNPAPSPSSPQPPGTSVLFTAQAGGGSGTPEYQFWLFDGTSWTSQQGYGAGNTWTWNTTGRPAGTYQVQVWARNIGSGSAYEAFTALETYVLQ